jgi:hypothetical protein
MILPENLENNPHAMEPRLIILCHLPTMKGKMPNNLFKFLILEKIFALKLPNFTIFLGFVKKTQ